MTLELKSVTKRVGAETHIADVSIKLERGTLNVLLGPTLSGKTSLMRLMAGLDAPTHGQVVVDGVDVTGLPVQRRSVAMVYQQFINYPNLSVYENIASPLRVAGLGRADIDQRVRQAAAMMKLEPLLGRKPLELSGGQQQRTALARAVVKEADLLLLDEPLANLDYKLREELREELPRLFERTGGICVYATTEPSEALLLGANTATLHEGRIAQFGPTVDVYRRPKNLVSAQTFSDPPMNVTAATKRGGEFRLAESLALPAGGETMGIPDGDYVLGFRPNHLFLRRPSTDAVALTGRVVLTEISGSESFVHVAFGPNSWVALAPGIHNLDVGQPIELFLDPYRFFVFDRDGDLAATTTVREAA